MHGEVIGQVLQEMTHSVKTGSFWRVREHCTEKVNSARYHRLEVVRPPKEEKVEGYEKKS